MGILVILAAIGVFLKWYDYRSGDHTFPNSKWKGRRDS